MIDYGYQGNVCLFPYWGWDRHNAGERRNFDTSLHITSIEEIFSNIWQVGWYDRHGVVWCDLVRIEISGRHMAGQVTSNRWHHWRPLYSNQGNYDHLGGHLAGTTGIITGG